MLLKNILSKSLIDLLSKDLLIFIIKMGLSALAITSVLIWSTWDILSAFIISYLAWIPWEWLQTSGASVATLALAYILFIIIVSLLTSLYSEKLLIALAKKHYPHVQVVGTPSISISLLLTLKASMIFLILFMVLLPLIFIPIFGQIVLLYLWSILLKEPTVYDVGALFIDDKDILKSKIKKTRILAMIASLFNYVPLVNIFAPVFAQILFLHHILAQEK